MQRVVRQRAPGARDFGLFDAMPPEIPPCLIEIIEPYPEDCPTITFPPEGNVKFRNYRFFNSNLRAYSPTGDIHTSPAKRKVVPRFDVFTKISPPRAKILELLRPEDPGRDALEEIVRPTPRRGLTRPLDEDTRRFLERALQSPSPLSAASTPESQKSQSDQRTEPIPSSPANTQSMDSYRSLADELREAEEAQKLETAGCSTKRELLREFRRRGALEAFERERLAKLALSVEEDEDGLSAAARRLDALLAESRDLHEELAGIHEDIQIQSERAGRCAVAARALSAESSALRFLDDVLALLRGDVAAAARARAWPFAIGRRQPGRNYVI